MKKAIFGVAGPAALALLCTLSAPAALSQAAAGAGSSGADAMRIMGVLLLAILWWVGGVFPDWIIALSMLLLWTTVGKLPFSAVFAGYADASMWLVVGAFCLAGAVTKAGLFQRISWFLLRLFPPTFPGQTLALLAVGTLCAPLMPSVSVKAILGANIAFHIANAMGYPPGDRRRCGLFLSAYTGFVASSPAFMSGSVFTYTLLGVLRSGGQNNVSWISWCVIMLPWLAVTLAGMYGTLLLTPGAREPTHLSSAYIQNEYRKLGPMGKTERKAAVLLTLAAVLWGLETALGIPAAVTALAVGILCFLWGILDLEEISTAIPWNLILFLGAVLNLGQVLSAAGLDSWLQFLLTPLVSRIASPCQIAAMVFIFVLALRVILVSQAATVILAMAILSSAAASICFPPLLLGMTILAAEQCWLLPYQNTVFSSALACMKGTVLHRDTVRYSLILECVSLAAILISIPCWKALGVLE